MIRFFEVTSKPLIFDGDTGGKIEHFDSKIKTMERLGISSIIIEDKKGLKKEFSLSNTKSQIQEDIKIFSEKISTGKKSTTQ